MAKTFQIATFHGDGIGPEIMAPTLDILAHLAQASGSYDLTFTDTLAGAAHCAKTGEALPESSLRTARQADAILLSAMGLPHVRYADGTEITPQIDLRIALSLYAGVRPVTVRPGDITPLKLPEGRQVDFVLIRESTEGLFFTKGRGEVNHTEARETLRITRATSEKLFRFAFDLAAQRKASGDGPGRVTCVDKANVLRAFAFFRKIFDEEAARHPDVQADHAYVDAMALWMITRPWDFDVLVTENMFDDILSDLGAGLMGGLGMAPSADIGDDHAVFQPCHGSAPDIAGQGVANPIAMILSGAMMLEWLGLRHDLQEMVRDGRRLRAAVGGMVADGNHLTRDLGGKAGTVEAVSAVSDALFPRVTLRVACVGAGYFSQFHYGSWARMDRASAVAACDRDLARAQATGLTAYDDLSQMLTEQSPDLLDIILPPEAHAETIWAALNAGTGAIICQKPFCISLEEARDITVEAEAAGTALIIHENFRFQPWYRRIKAVSAEGLLGEIQQLTFRLRPGDGQGPRAYLDRQPYFQTMPRYLVRETAVHWVDMFRFLLGNPQAVYADLRRVNPVIAGEDAGYILFEHRNGARAIFDGNRSLDHAATNTRRTMGEALLEGTEGTVTLGGDGALQFRAFGALETRDILPPDTHDGFGGDCVHRLQSHVVDALLDGGPLENTARDYLRVREIEEAIYRSAKTGAKLSV